MNMCYIRAEIIGELPSGKKRVHLLANDADGITFYTDDKSIIKNTDIITLPSEPKTNIERIKAMSVEEMAELFNDWLYEGACNHGLDIERECDHNCIECIKQYLKSEVQEDEHV